jgi:hypothetical protein
MRRRPPERQCYAAPEDYGSYPDVTIVQLKKGLPALLFSTASGGVSGFMIHFALLRPGSGKDLEDLFGSGVSVSNQSQHAFWMEPTISDAPFFVTADFIWGPDESHYSPHRFVISAYVQRRSNDLDGDYYFLQDRYMTVRTYDLEADDNVLGAEKVQIIARLRRIKRAQSRMH